MPELKTRPGTSFFPEELVGTELVDGVASNWVRPYANPHAWHEELTAEFSLVDVADQIRAREEFDAAEPKVPDFIPAVPPAPPVELTPERFSIAPEEMPVARDGTVLVKRELLKRIFGDSEIVKLAIWETDEPDPTRPNGQIRLFESANTATFAVDFTITEIIAAIAWRYKPSDSSLPRIAHMRRAINGSTYRHVLNDPRFGDYLSLYNCNPNNFVSHVLAQRKHRAYTDKVLNSPARAMYLESHAGTGNLLSQIYRDESHGRSN